MMQLILAALAAMVLSGVPAQAQRTAATQGSPAGSAPSGTSYAIGDRLRVNIFEQLDVPQAASARSRDMMRAYYQRVDLGGEYAVEADGTLNLPRIGRFPVAGRSVDEVRRDLSEALQKETGRFGDIHIAILERQPVYVVGHVRQPGSFRYVPGMIAIQAIALAGGTDRLQDRGLTAIDASRERERGGLASGRLAGLLARRAVLAAIRDRAAPQPSQELVALVGAPRARELVETERHAAERAHEERAGEGRRLTGVLAAARDELRSLQSASGEARRLAQARQGEIARVSEPDPRLTNRQVVSGLQAEAADFTLRERQFQMAASQVEQRIAQTLGDLSRLDLQFRAETSRELAKVEQELADLRQAASAAGTIADQIQVRAGGEAVERLTFEIVRRSRTLPAEATSLLEPGDVVQVKAPPPAGARP